MSTEITQFQIDYLKQFGKSGQSILERIETDPKIAVMWPREPKELIENMDAYEQQVREWQGVTPEQFSGGELPGLAPQIMCNQISEKVRLWVGSARAKAKLTRMGYSFEGEE